VLLVFVSVGRAVFSFFLAVYTGSFPCLPLNFAQAFRITVLVSKHPGPFFSLQGVHASGPVLKFFFFFGRTFSPTCAACQGSFMRI